MTKGLICTCTCTCNPSSDLTEAVRELTDCVKTLKNITFDISQLKTTIDGNPKFIEPDFSEIDPNTRHPCGGTPGWRRVAYLNMSDTRHLCPAGYCIQSQSEHAVALLIIC